MSHPSHRCCSPSTVSRTQEDCYYFISFGEHPPTKRWCIWQVHVSSVVIWRFCFYSMLIYFYIYSSCCGRWMKTSFLPCSCQLLLFIFVVFGGENGTFFLVKTTETFSAVKVDSHQKGIKGPISASTCRVMYTVPNMKCFFVVAALIRSCFAIFLFVFCSYYCRPRLPGGFCTL